MGTILVTGAGRGIGAAAAVALAARGHHVVAADYVGRGRLAHGTAKAALRVFARQVAAETAWDGIAVVTVEPDAVRTEGLAAALGDEALETLAGRTLHGRMVSPEDVAEVVAVALDPAVPTGTVLTVDAGRSLLVGGPR